MSDSNEIKQSQDEGREKSPGIQENTPSLPKGGGAVQGIGETFQPNAFSGTGSYGIPISITPARDFEPSLSLAYNSGSGNGSFGTGFNISLPNISRRTEKGIPTYTGTDTFVFSESGELVPRLKDEKGKWVKDQRNVPGENGCSWLVTVYLPRVEAAFSKIEFWECIYGGNGGCTEGASYWKITSRNNVTSYYGKDEHARIADPENGTHIFQWLLQEAVDARGNKIQYIYKAENNAGVPAAIYEQNRTVTANRYIERIKYGNYFNESKDQNNDEQFAFEVVFDYGEYDLSGLNQPGANPYIPVKPWSCRPDPFSSYRSGFEVRTFRLCRNIMMFHLFKEELGETPCLTRVTGLKYKESPTLSSIEKVTVTGYRRIGDGSYIDQSMPTIELDFSTFDPPTAPGFKTLEVEDGSLPGYLDQSQFLPVDLNGEGLPGFLYSNNETTLYFQPRGDGTYGAPEPPAAFPIDKDIQSGEAVFNDLDGNGIPDLVVNVPWKTGFYPQHTDRTWGTFQPFESYPTDIADPTLERVGLVGNGRTDLMQVRSTDLSVYYSEGKRGYSPARSVLKRADFPSPKGDYPEELVSFSDMFGDGLAHRVSIQSGTVACWPNLGYGRFGEKVMFGNSPRFDGELDIRRLLFADIDGSGTSDLVYIYPDRVEIYFNRSGNSFSEPLTLMLPEPYSEIDKIQFADILGNGTSCLVFTRIEPTPRHYYYNFVGETVFEDGTVIPALKPYLLMRIDNNMGAVTYIQYCSSTKFYLEDKRAGRPWVTRLPFPVQVVEAVIHLDRLTGSRYVNRFKYHDGYYDPVEREFRGFGYVETWDTESFEKFSESHIDPYFPVESLNSELYVPPVYTRSWYNTGAYTEEEAIALQYRSEYWKGGGTCKTPFDIPGNVIDPGISSTENSEIMRQAHVALKGTIIRTEVYGLDPAEEEKSKVPYSVDQSNFEVRMVQPLGGQKYAVFMVSPHEAVSYQYDQNPDDPRIQQHFILQVDSLSGEVEKGCTVFLPRCPGMADREDIYPEQSVLKATAGTNGFIDTPDNLPYRWRGVPCEEQQFQIFGLDLKGAGHFTYNELKSQAEAAMNNIVPYEGTLQQGTLQARQLTWSRTYYWDESQNWDETNDGALPPGHISQRGLVHHAEKAVFTTSFIQDVFTGQLDEKTIAEQGGFIYDEETGYWWNKRLVQYYYKEPFQFYMPNMTQNPYNPSSSSPSPLSPKAVVDFQTPYYFSPVKVTRYVDSTTGNIETFAVDYRVMRPYQIVDVNDNVSQVLFDPLGQVTVSTVFGTEGETAVGGMSLYPYGGQPAQYQPRKTNPSGGPISFDDVLADPGYYLQGASEYFYYDLQALRQDCAPGKCQPVNAIQLTRVNDYLTAAGETPFSCITAVAYSDGNGKILETKLKVDPAETGKKSKKGKKGDRPETGETGERWQVSGKTVYNNKGKPTMEYLPYFSDNPYYETGREAVYEAIVPPPTVTHYDPLERVIRVDTPKGFFTRSQYTPWQEIEWDEDDTVKESTYYIEFMKNYPADPTERQKDEKDALDKAAKFYDTPSVRILDNRGYTIRDIKDNQEQNPMIAFYRVDVQGRVLESVDPRLYWSNLDLGTQYYNFKYLYLMDEETPLYIDSVDAGINRTFNNIFNHPAVSWNAENFNTRMTYDTFQRPTRVEVVKIDSDGKVIFDNVVETVTYGESLSKEEAQPYNLLGQSIRANDQAGIGEVSLYGLRGQALRTCRRLTKQYDGVIDWKAPSQVEMEKESYPFIFVYDAREQLISETTPDGSVTVNTYNLGGLLDGIGVETAGETTGESQQGAIRKVQYNANGQRIKVDYGSGVSTDYIYEDTTGHLLNIYSSRPGDTPADRILQNQVYTYDPVGNITRMRDNTYEHVFCNNQEVSPLSGYTYGAIYRLKKAEGRQHPGIGKDTHINGFMQSEFGYLCPPDPKDYTKLQNYWEDYTYDNSNNLVNKQHNTGSPDGSWSQPTPVEDNSNRLKDRAYDAAGNLLTLELNNSVTLYWDYQNRLAKTGIIQREDNIDDADYFNYDSGGTRVRKVVQRMAHGGSVTQVEEKIYLGNFEVKRIKSSDVNGEVTILDRQTLRVMDDNTCVLILHHWLQDDRQREVPKAGTWKQRYQLADILGSVSLETDQNAAVISYEEYFPYGGTSIIAGNDITEVALKEYRYSGKELDDSTGLYYYGARYYAPWLGRWISADPSGASDGLNLFTFVGNNPVSKFDEDGRWGWLAALGTAVGATVTGAVGGLMGRYSGWGVGTGGGIVSGSVAGVTGAVVGGLIMGSGAGAIGLMALAAVGTSVVSSYVGGYVGQKTMQQSSTPRTQAITGTLTSSLTGVIIGAGITGLTQGTLMSGNVLIGAVTGAGSAVLSAGSHLGFARTGEGVLNPVIKTDFSDITPAVPPKNVLPKLQKEGHMLLVLGPQKEAISRYNKSYKNKEEGVFYLDPVKKTGSPMHVVAIHGMMGYVLVSTGTKGNVMRPMPIKEFAEYVKSELNKQGYSGDTDPIKLISCFGGAYFPLSNAQVLANVTGRNVYGFKKEEDQAYSGPWRQFKPQKSKTN